MRLGATGDFGGEDRDMTRLAFSKSIACFVKTKGEQGKGKQGGQLGGYYSKSDNGFWWLGYWAVEVIRCILELF